MQLCVAMLLGIASYIHSWNAAVSIFFGALIVAASNLAAAVWYFRNTGSARKPRAILRRAYVSEALKLLTTICLFVIAFSVTDIWLPLFLFAGYLSSLLVNWLMLLIKGS